MDSADRLREERGDRDHRDLRRELDRLRLDRVRDDQALDRAAIQAIHRSLGEDAVGDDRGDGARAARHELLGGLGERAGADREVVDDDGVAIGDLADDLHELGALAVVLANLVGDRERRPEPMGEPARTLGEPGVGRDDDRIAQPRVLDRPAEVRHRIEIVDGHPEEALDLRCVQIERDHAIRARSLDRVGADTRADRHPRLVLLVALGVAEVRNHHCDRARARA